MKTIMVYGSTTEDILDKILVEKVLDIITWKNEEYYVWNSDLGYLKHPPSGKYINEYNGEFFFFYDD